MRVSYHASHEQFPPSEMLRLASLAVELGFGGITSSDHFHPWSEEQGESGFAWSWLGAAMHAVPRVPVGVVTAPGAGRYHPAVLAQAAATLDEMFPGRLWLAFGSGELLNEGVTGGEWPPHEVRDARLLESVEVMRRLWAGETVTHEGLVTVRQARLYTLPKEPPVALCAALSERTAEWAGSWADGLLTSARPRPEMRRLVQAFRRGGGDGKPVHLKVDVSWAPTEAEALERARSQWRATLLGRSAIEETRTPAEFDEASRFVRAEDMRGAVRFGTAQQHAEWLREDAEDGFTHITVHDVGREQERFVREFAEQVLPLLRKR